MNRALDDQIRWKQNIPPASVALEPFTEEVVVARYLSAYRSENEGRETNSADRKKCAS
jgi:hypothetical protein